MNQETLGKIKEELSLLEELAAPYKESRQPGDIDKFMLSDAAGIGPNQAAVRLTRLADEGKLRRVKVFEKGKWVNVFRKP